MTDRHSHLSIRVFTSTWFHSTWHSTLSVWRYLFCCLRMCSFDCKLLIAISEFGVLTDGTNVLVEYVIVVTNRRKQIHSMHFKEYFVCHCTVSFMAQNVYLLSIQQLPVWACWVNSLQQPWGQCCFIYTCWSCQTTEFCINLTLEVTGKSISHWRVNLI